MKIFVTMTDWCGGASLVRTFLARGSAVKRLVRAAGDRENVAGLDVESSAEDLRDSHFGLYRICSSVQASGRSRNVEKAL